MDPNIVARLVWIAERIEDGDLDEAAYALRDLIDELRAAT
jgi:hypothetical protein